MPGFDLGQVQDVVDQVQQGLGRAVNGAQVMGLLGVRAGFQEDLAQPDDGVHGRAYFVTDVIQEFRFGLVGRLRRRMGFAQGLGGFFREGDLGLQLGGADPLGVGEGVDDQLGDGQEQREVNRHEKYRAAQRQAADVQAPGGARNKGREIKQVARHAHQQLADQGQMELAQGNGRAPVIQQPHFDDRPERQEPEQQRDQKMLGPVQVVQGQHLEGVMDQQDQGGQDARRLQRHRRAGISDRLRHQRAAAGSNSWPTCLRQVARQPGWMRSQRAPHSSSSLSWVMPRSRATSAGDGGTRVIR